MASSSISHQQWRYPFHLNPINSTQHLCDSLFVVLLWHLRSPPPDCSTISISHGFRSSLFLHSIIFECKMVEEARSLDTKTSEDETKALAMGLMKVKEKEWLNIVVR
ncbi:unnamed protein product [Vicia faba]|uniref:Uncharacterized protein n=1 Tax=Vicia faba TaxID=3906 RepID=A0AAV1AA72_VICFA|nr:unnamed protein product [Vicia faba]